MKRFGKKSLAYLLSLIMVMSVVSPTAFANETVPETSPIETVEETRQAETEAPETEAPASESEKEDPATAAEETSPQETEKETPAKETEAPSKETEAPTTKETEAPATETEAPTTKETEDPTKESEDPAKESEDPTKESEDPTKESEDPTKESEDPTKESEDPTKESEEPSRGGKKGEPTRDGEAETITVTFNPNTEPDGTLAFQTIEVNSGEAIGNKLPAVPTVPGYRTKWVKEGTTTEVTAETVVTEPFTAVVDQEKIIYTVTFVQEDGTQETRTTSITEGFAVNDLPEVAAKTNKVGKWVYPGTTREFTVGTVISEDLTVNAYYEQNIFTVKFMVDNAQYEEMTTATGTTIILPSDPTKADGPVDPSLVVTKDVDDKKYDLGEEIEFTVTATNIYKDAKTITLTEIDGVTLDKSVFEDVTGGKTVTTTARYTVQEADILKGEFTNTVTASFNDGIEAQAEATAYTADKNAHMTVEKECTSEPENGETYALGEKITWKITVTNDGNVTISGITVTDELTGDEWTVKSLAPGESKEFEAEYTVTEDDILAGKVENTADATGEDPDGEDPDVDPGTDEEPTDPKNSHLTVEKVATSEPKNGTGYAEGEKITWKITVTNDGNVTIKNITVTDELTGDEWTIDSLAPGDSKEFKAEYTVTAGDVKEGSVTNTATATGEDPEGDEPDVDPGTDDEPTVNPKAHLTVKKVATSTPKNGKKYDEGETITWKITVVNDGEVEVTDIKVEDKLVNKTWTIDSLKPGESQEFEASYTVTKADKEAGKVVNVATATGKVPDGGKPDVTPGKDEEPVVPEVPVQTGDDSNMWLWTILMAASTVSMGAIMLTAKKRRFEEE